MNFLRYKTIICILIIISLFACNGLNVKPNYSEGFIKFFGGALPDYASKVELTSDGGYIVVGSSNSVSNGSTDVYVVKTDASGNMVWQKNFGGPNADFGNSIKQTADGYIVVGSTTLDNNIKSMYILKLDPNGAKLWSDTAGMGSFGSDVQLTDDGGYIFIGNSVVSGVAKIFLYKTDMKGNRLFKSELYGFNGNNTQGNSLVHEGDTVATWVGESPGKSLIARNRPGGNTFAYDKTDDFLKENSINSFSQIQKTKDGGYIISGTSINGSGNSDAFLLKLTGDLKSNPTKAWFHVFDLGGNEVGSSVDETVDGGYILTGYTTSVNGNGQDVYLVKADGAGNEVWHQTFGGKKDDYGTSLKQASDGGYIIACTMSLEETTGNDAGNQKVCLIKTDANGMITNK